MLFCMHSKKGIFHFLQSLLKLFVFVHFILKLGSQLMNCFFQGFHLRAFFLGQLQINHSSNGDSHDLRIDWEKFKVAVVEGLFDFIKREEGIGLKRASVPIAPIAFRLDLDDEFAIELVKGKSEMGLFLCKNVVFLGEHDNDKGKKRFESGWRE